MDRSLPQSTTLTLRVNGQTYTRWIPASLTLLEFLREDLKLTGTKRGCDFGECGCCTVLIDDKPILSCLTLAVEAEGHEVRTIEGVATGAELHPVQEAMVSHGAIQCGFCTPAMVMNAVHLLNENKKPNTHDIKECISGTICRCTGYTKIEKAIAAAVKKMKERELS
jgi:aerobic carbon-monoxide dehydrogenase small subunit